MIGRFDASVGAHECIDLFVYPGDEGYVVVCAVVPSALAILDSCATIAFKSLSGRTANNG